MNEFSNSVMIALLPTTSYWCHIELPHLTLVYVGQIEDLTPVTHNELAKAAMSLAMMNHPFSLDVLDADILGDEDKVEVLLLRPSTSLLGMRQTVERWNASQYPFNPHVTVGPIGSLGDVLPQSITFDRIMVAWGDETLTYKL